MKTIKPTQTPTYKTPLTAWVMALSLTLTACGGGGSSTATPTPTPTPTPSGTSSATPTPSGTLSATPSATPSPSGTPSATPTPTPTPVPAPTPTAAECPFGNYQADVYAAVNAFRASPQYCGSYTSSSGTVIPAQTYPAATGLNSNSQLESAAAVHSNDMAINNFFAHLSPTTNKTFRERQRDAGYNWTTGGENIAAGQSSASEVVGDWIGSPSHCANLMVAAYRDVGVSCKFNSAATYQNYWTLEMGVR